MSMVLCARRIARGDLEYLTTHPSETFRYLTGENPKRLFLLSLFAKKPPPRHFPEPDDREDLDLDKSWDGLHFCLTGSAKITPLPEGMLFDDGRCIGSDELGYGKPWALDPAQVRRFAEAIAPLGEADLKARYDPERMEREKVYLSNAFVRDGEDGFAYIWDNFLVLRRYVLQTVERGQGLIVWLT